MAAERIDPRSGLFTFLDVDAGQSGWRDQFVENWMRLALTRPAPVLDRDLTSPPAEPDDLAVYIPAPAATGAWEGHEDELAVWDDVEGDWLFFEPVAGWTAVIIDEAVLSLYTDAGWTTGADLDPS